MKRIKCLIVIPLMFLTSCSDFQEKGKPVFKNLTILYDLSLTKCKITQEVWSTAIFDDKYALSTSKKFDDYYVKDFNVALVRMENEPTIKDMNSEIDLLSESVTQEIEKISDKKNESYDKLISLYTNVLELSKKAITPSGSLQSYTNDINQKESQINMLITEIKARNPTFEVGTKPENENINPQLPQTSF